MTSVERLLDSILTALTIGVPVLVGALVTLAVQWLRVRRAQLRAQRQQLPLSTDPPPLSTEPPPPPKPWYSVRPKRKAKRS